MTITKEYINKKYGNANLKRMEEAHSDDMLEHLNDWNSKVFQEVKDQLPIGLENKICVYWFQHFFNRDEKQINKNFTPSIYISDNPDFFNTKDEVDSFNCNWLDIPFPNAKSIQLLGDSDNRIDLVDDAYNWYELFIIINDLMWKYGRLLDIGISSIECAENKICVNWSS